MTIAISGTTGITLDGQFNSASSMGFKNRIINGAMVIDQRNAGASVTPANAAYTLDRWQAFQSVASKYSVQQNAGSVTPPAGFTNYLGVTSLSAYSVASGDYFALNQSIEGFNVADFGFGTASASTVILSFLVRSSLTGTFGGALKNSAGNRSYPFTYTISSANTWEQKTIIIAGDTSGTWLTNNGVGIYVQLGLGTGSTWNGTAGSWSANNYISATGATSVVGTNGATFYITGVQLEAGTTASPFEYRLYGTELALCQRYYYRITAAGASRILGNGYVNSTTVADYTLPFPVTMRDEPSALEQTGTAANYAVLTATGAVNCSAVPSNILNSQWGASFRFTVASGLTTGQAVFARNVTTGAYLGWSAEL
jgi:hypothetical protein